MKFSSGGKFLKADDLKNGEVLTILDAGEISLSEKFTYPDGNPRKEFVFRVKGNNVEGKLRFNYLTRKKMVEAFGEDSEGWVSKQAIVSIEPSPIGNGTMIILNPVREPSMIPGF